VLGAAGSCLSALRGVKLTPHGRRARIAFTRRAGTRRVSVDVFQESVGRHVLARGRLLAHFSRRRGFTWSGRSTRSGVRVHDGILFVRLKAPGRHGLDVRRFILRRSSARLHRRPASSRRPKCSGLIRYFALTRPVFGGRTGRALHVVIQPARRARVSYAVRQGGRVVRRYKARTVRGSAIAKRTIVARGLRRGDARIQVTVRAGRTTRHDTLTARRL
jgi:hypothetical protein